MTTQSGQGQGGGQGRRQESRQLHGFRRGGDRCFSVEHGHVGDDDRGEEQEKEHGGRRQRRGRRERRTAVRSPVLPSRVALGTEDVGAGVQGELPSEPRR